VTATPGNSVTVDTQHGDVVHVRDGMFPCGAIVDVLERDEVMS
jgi:hypothetical protein